MLSTRFSIAQLPLTYQPASTLFCVRALYVEVEAANKTARTIDVYNEARRGGIKGEPVDTPDLVAHPDDLPDAAANEATRASKLRVGLAVFDHIYGYNASMQPADANTRLAEMMPADNEALISGVDKATLIQLLKALLFGPVRARFCVACAASQPSVARPSHPPCLLPRSPRLRATRVATPSHAVLGGLRQRRLPVGDRHRRAPDQAEQ